MSHYSIWEGNDCQLLEWAIPFYLRDTYGLILDATVGGWRFWKGLSNASFVVGIDLLRKDPRTIIMDNQRMAFRDNAFAAVIFDPPHMPERHIGQDYGGLAGLFESGHGAANATHLYRPFLVEASRVLETNGILMAKITDNVHRAAQQWEHVTYVNALSDYNLTACDLIIKTRQGPMMDPKWRQQLHVRKRHSFWVVARKGKC
ncbi:hypothetical protein LCGC14_2989500 [marine sediment metagenome]|uniref:DNA methylase N-4/N-6 domain-containing protein n=1 Tax=marine sediment metagenome TaxID=412755 RepID=A0A0F8ZBT1_9ZZZZ